MDYVSLLKEIRSILLPEAKGLKVVAFVNTWHRLLGYNFPLKDAMSAENFFRSIPDVVTVSGQGDDILLKAVPTESTKHIAKMVACQKPAKTKREFRPVNNQNLVKNPTPDKKHLALAPFKPCKNQPLVDSQTRILPQTSSQIQPTIKKLPITLQNQLHELLLGNEIFGIRLINLTYSYKKKFPSADLEVQYKSLGFCSIHDLVLALPDIVQLQTVHHKEGPRIYCRSSKSNRSRPNVKYGKDSTTLSSDVPKGPSDPSSKPSLHNAPSNAVKNAVKGKQDDKSCRQQQPCLSDQIIIKKFEKLGEDHQELFEVLKHLGKSVDEIKQLFQNQVNGNIFHGIGDGHHRCCVCPGGESVQKDRVITGNVGGANSDIGPLLDKRAITGDLTVDGVNEESHGVMTVGGAITKDMANSTESSCLEGAASLRDGPTLIRGDKSDKNEDWASVIPLPIGSRQEFDALCKKLEDKKIKRKMKTVLAALQGQSIGDTVFKILARIGTHNLWSQFSYYKEDGKISFKESPILKMITKKCKSDHPDVKSRHVKGEISHYLNHVGTKRTHTACQENAPKKLKTDEKIY